MKKIGALIVVIAVAAGCSFFKGSDPNAVAEKFWSLSKAGDFENMKEYVTKGSVSSLQKNQDTSNSGEVTLGKAKIEGDKASVPTTLKQEGVAIEMQTILIKEDGKWKVDVANTMMTMFGSAMEQMFKAMGTGVGDAMKGLGEGVDEAMKGIQEGTKGVGAGMGQAVQGVAEGMKNLGEQLGKATGEKIKEAGKAMEEAGQKVTDKLAKAPDEKATETSTPSDKSFKVGDPALVEWHGQWWPAHVIEVKTNSWKINYDGYSNSWDEWVGPERIKVK